VSVKTKILKFFGLILILGGGEFITANVTTSCGDGHNNTRLDISSIIEITNLGQIIGTIAPTAQQIRSKVIKLNSGADALN
jgi:hypothetical protein